MMTFCWLPPDSVDAAASIEGVRTSNSSTRSAAWRRTAPAVDAQPRREKGRLSIWLSTRFDGDRERADRARRAGGPRARAPARRANRWRGAVAGDVGAVEARPCRRRAARRPQMASTSSVWPLPCTPATATISPARTSSDTPSTTRWPRSSLTTRSPTSSTARPARPASCRRRAGPRGRPSSSPGPARRPRRAWCCRRPRRRAARVMRSAMRGDLAQLVGDEDDRSGRRRRAGG